jgi:hypothetical protein
VSDLEAGPGAESHSSRTAVLEPYVGRHRAPVPEPRSYFDVVRSLTDDIEVLAAVDRAEAGESRDLLAAYVRGRL